MSKDQNTQLPLFEFDAEHIAPIQQVIKTRSPSKHLLLVTTYCC